MNWKNSFKILIFFTGIAFSIFNATRMIGILILGIGIGLFVNIIEDLKDWWVK